LSDVNKKTVKAAAADPIAEATSMVRIAVGTESLSPAQKLFNKLTGQIETARKLLTEWIDFAHSFRADAAAKQAEGVRKQRASKIELARVIDQLLLLPPRGFVLKKSTQAGVVLFLLQFIESALADAPDAELEALYDRHAERPYAQRLAEIRAQQLRFAESEVREQYGDDWVDGHNAKDADEFFRHLEEKLRARFEATQGTSEPDPSAEPQPEPADEAFSREHARAQKKAQRQEQALKEASLSVREIYRKLASSLHPDREPDADERARKTLLMQEINAAYENNDLLALLGLQMRVEQIDSSTLASLPKQRLRYYNEVLRDQLRTLELEIREMTSDLLAVVGIYERPGFHVEQRYLNNQLRKIEREEAEVLEEMLSSIESLRSERTRLTQLERYAFFGKASARATREVGPRFEYAESPPMPDFTAEVKFRKKRSYTPPE